MKVVNKTYKFQIYPNKFFCFHIIVYIKNLILFFYKNLIDIENHTNII